MVTDEASRQRLMKRSFTEPHCPEDDEVSCLTPQTPINVVEDPDQLRRDTTDTPVSAVRYPLRPHHDLPNAVTPAMTETFRLRHGGRGFCQSVFEGLRYPRVCCCQTQHHVSVCLCRQVDHHPSLLGHTDRVFSSRHGSTGLASLEFSRG